jgi:glycosyltransferase involved in cell wall biosynthesis
LKKILIISYFYPPSNFVGGDRVAAWAKYLYQYGYYPTIVTRNWNEGQKELTDSIQNNQLKHEVFDTHEIYRIPYHRSLRDKLNDYPNNKFLTVIRKFLSYTELILNNFFLKALPYNNLYDFSKELILTRKDYELLIVSGRPFQLFHIAHQLNKTTGIKWVADYRDEWNTFQNRSEQSMLLKLVSFFEKKSELKWTASAQAFITVSNHWKNSISDFIGKKGFTVMNGFEEEIFLNSGLKKINNKKIVISYLGTLYPQQKIELFIESIKKCIVLFKNQIDFEINFIGIETIESELKKVMNLIEGYDEYFNIIERVSKKDVASYYVASDFLLATGYESVKGWIPVKVFQYAASNTPIILYPTDDDIIEDFILKTNSGFVLKKESEFIGLILEFIENKKKNKLYSTSINFAELSKYSRKNQTKILSQILTQN